MLSRASGALSAFDDLDASMGISTVQVFLAVARLSECTIHHISRETGLSEKRALEEFLILSGEARRSGLPWILRQYGGKTGYRPLLAYKQKNIDKTERSIVLTERGRVLADKVVADLTSSETVMLTPGICDGVREATEENVVLISNLQKLASQTTHDLTAILDAFGPVMADCRFRVAIGVNTAPRLSLMFMLPSGKTFGVDSSWLDLELDGNGAPLNAINYHRESKLSTKPGDTLPLTPVKALYELFRNEMARFHCCELALAAQHQEWMKAEAA